MKNRSLIEPLEDRIAPATIVNPFTVTYQNYETNSGGTQIAGDTVVVSISKPLFASAKVAAGILAFTSTPGGSSITENFTGNTTAESLSNIDLTGIGAAQGMNISVRVIPQVGIGNGNVSVGAISAGTFVTNGPLPTDELIGAIGLGSIDIQGSLGSIFAGGSLSVPAIQSLTVQSLTNARTVFGSIGKVDVLGDLTGYLNVVGYSIGNIGQLIIGGSLTGDSAGDQDSGIVQFTGHIGSATIGNIVGSSVSSTGELVGISGGINSLHVTGSFTGGSAQQSGTVFVTNGNIGHITIDGDFTGGSGPESGVISANSGSIGTIHIGGSINGGSGQESAIISVTGSIGSLQVLGSINGGTGLDSGLVSVSNNIGNVAVTGSITGGSAGTAADSVTLAAAVPGVSGAIEAGQIGAITIGGSLIGGTPNTSSTVSSSDSTVNQTADTSGAILTNSIGSLLIKGSIMGNAGPTNGFIGGEPGSGALVNYGSIVVDGALVGGSGSMSGSILAGTTNNGSFFQTFGQIASIHVGGSVTGGSGAQSGEIAANFGSLGGVYIGKNLTGGSASLAGVVSAGNSIGKLFVGGNIIGGTVSDTGEITANGPLTMATIGGNLDGNAPAAPFSSTTAITDTGYIHADHIGTLNIMGNVTAGSNTTGPIGNSGAIRSDIDIGSLTIHGTVTGTAANPFIISAEQGPQSAPHITSDLAIGSVTVDGAASYLDVLAGYSSAITPELGSVSLGAPVDGSAQIGTLTFGATLNAGNLVAGAKPDPTTGNFGTAANTAIAPRFGAFGVISSIADIVVAQAITGDSTPADSFGIVAEHIGTIEVHMAGVSTNGLIPGVPTEIAGNVFLVEPLLT